MTPIPAQPEFDSGLMWFRRDLRCHDNPALWLALRSCRKVYCVFTWDSDMLDPLPRSDRRVEFIHHSLDELDSQLRRLAQIHHVPDAEHAGLIFLRGRAQVLLPELAYSLGVQAVFANHDEEPATMARDNQVRGGLSDRGISLRTCKDHVIFGRDELLTANQTPFTSFAPYLEHWLARLTPWYLSSYPSSQYSQRLTARPPAWRQAPPTLEALGFHATNLDDLAIHPGTSGAHRQWEEFMHRMQDFPLRRQFPSVRGPSYLGVHLRFGTLSIREAARSARERQLQGDTGAGAWLAQLAQRDYCLQLLYHLPQLTDKAFHPELDRLPWDHGPHGKKLFQAWCEGRTGYPLVDAAMRQLQQSGYMHHQLRVLTANFLTRHLNVDWRWGLRHFDTYLNDAELASNLLGWQWAAGVGPDALPWFRILDPVRQSQQLDPQGKFIRRYLPELAALSDEDLHAPWETGPLELEAAGVILGNSYPKPIVELKASRRAALERRASLRGSRAPRR